MQNSTYKIELAVDQNYIDHNVSFFFLSKPTSDEIFMPKSESELDGDVDDFERELEEFKR